MRIQKNFNDKRSTLWNCAKDIIMYGYLDYNVYLYEENKIKNK